MAFRKKRDLREEKSETWNLSGNTHGYGGRGMNHFTIYYRPWKKAPNSGKK